jgi:hypothetical protein
VSAAGRGSQVLIVERRFIASGADIVIRRRAGVTLCPEIAFSRTHYHASTQKFA